MLANVKQATIAHEVKSTITPGSLIFTDEYKISARLIAWDISTHCVCHAQGVCPLWRMATVLWSPRQHSGKVLVPTSFLRPHPGISQAKLLYLGFLSLCIMLGSEERLLSALLECLHHVDPWNPLSVSKVITILKQINCPNCQSFKPLPFRYAYMLFVVQILVLGDSGSNGCFQLGG